MYIRGDKGGNNNTNHSANMMSNQVAAQMAALEERNNDLEDNQFKLNDAFAQMIRGGASIGREGGIPPVIDTKSMGRVPTEGNTSYSSLMAQQSTQMKAMQAMVDELSKKILSGGGGGGDGGDRNRTCNKNTGDRSNKRVVSYWQQWNKYCHSCGVVLDCKAGCGTSGGKDCYLKKAGHKNAATFTNKLGGNTKRDHLRQLWYKPVTNSKCLVLSAGAKIEKWWFEREPGNDKNTDNTNKDLLKLNPRLLCKPPTSQLATVSLSYADVIWKHMPPTLATLNIMRTHYIKSATKRLIYYLDSEETKYKKIKNILPKISSKTSNYFARQSRISIISMCATRKKAKERNTVPNMNPHNTVPVVHTADSTHSGNSNMHPHALQLEGTLSSSSRCSLYV